MIVGNIPLGGFIRGSGLNSSICFLAGRINRKVQLPKRQCQRLMRRVLGRHNTCVEQRLRIGIDTQMLEQLDRSFCVGPGRRFCLRNVRGIVRLFGRREIQFAELKTKQRRIGNRRICRLLEGVHAVRRQVSSFSGLDRHVLIRCWRKVEQLGCVQVSCFDRL